MPTDEQLIDEIKAGSQAAMELLVKRHYKHIFAYMYRRLGDYHLAYDLTQEVFIKMMQSIKRYRGNGKFRNWLLTIAVNHSRDFYRSKDFRNRKKEQKLTELIEGDGKVWDLLHKKIERKKIKDAVEQLPESQKEVIILHYYHDLKIKEIVKITGAKESTVKSRLRHGIKKLNVLLREGGEDNETSKRKKRFNSQ